MGESKEMADNVPFKLYRPINYIIIEFTSIINNKGLIFFREKTQTDFYLYGVIYRIKLVIKNLLSNAIKFTDTRIIEFTQNAMTIS